MKSPPELWAEVSDVAALTGHLGEFGEIRITRLEPETTVAWEGDRARGTVELEPSGWGTKVTLTARLEPEAAGEGVPEPVAAPASDEPGPEVTPPEPVVEEPPTEEPVAEEPVAEEPAPEEPAAGGPPVEEQPAPEQEPARRRGFFARLFARRRDPEADRDATVVEEAAPAPAPVVEEPEAASPAPPEPAPAPERAPACAETTPAPLSAGRAEEILVGVLDDLGAARHRPFSRG